MYREVPGSYPASNMALAGIIVEKLLVKCKCVLFYLGF